MNKHLNIFCSYSQGGFESIDEERILEDNVTRALITTLKYSEPSVTVEFLEEILELKIRTKTFNFDLQNIEDDDTLNRIHLASEKFVLGISPSGNDPFDNQTTQIPNHFMDKLDQFVKEHTEENNKPLKEIKKGVRGIIETLRERKEVAFDSQRKEFINIISKLSKIDDDFNWLFEIKDADLFDNFTYIYESLLGSRPDGWIWDDTSQADEPAFAVLIENKINGELNKTQIERHINRRTGFNSRIEEVRRKTVSWKDIHNFFKTYKTNEPNTDLLVHQFMEYLTMTNIVLDLSFIIQPDKGYDREIAKIQFRLLLAELDKKINEINVHPDLIRAHRRLDSIWDYYGVKKNQKDEVQLDPHYSLYLDKEGAGIALTTKGRKLIERLLESDKLKDFLEKIFDETPTYLLPRYSLTLMNYRLVDSRRGQMKGEKFSTFKFAINLSEMHGRKGEINDFLITMKTFTTYAKQVELLFMVTYPDVSKIRKKQTANEEESLRYSNAKLFENYNKLLEEYGSFIEQTKGLFLELNDIKKKLEQDK